MNRKSTLFVICFLISRIIVGQSEQTYPHAIQSSAIWVELMYQSNADPGDVTDAYNNYFKTHDFKKNTHTQYYKRWLRDISRTQLYKNHDPFYKKQYQQQLKNYLNDSRLIRSAESPSSNWTSLGPFDFDIEAASRSYAPGAAHVYTVEQSLSHPDILYAGTATAGLWKTVDKGQNWTLITGNMPFNRVFSLEIDPGNPDIVYFEGGGSIYKSVNGGLVWTVLGDSTFKSVSHSTKDIVIHPDSSHIIFLASNYGFYRSRDAGMSWDTVLAGSFQEIEIHPVSHNIVYLIEQSTNRTYFHKSLDHGLTFTIKSAGWPNQIPPDEQKRTEIAVTPAAPDKVYALATGAVNGGSGLYGIYISNNAGETWSFACCGPQPAGTPSLSNPNLMGWSDEGTDNGGQYYYDLALAVSPTDENKVHVGGVNHWVSVDGGNSFSCPSKWSHPDKKEYVHADIHDIRYFGNDLWFACDGGVFYSSTSGDTISRMMKGLEGTDFWGFGTGYSNGNVMLGGTYHNGTLLKDGDTYINGWISTQGGDNYRGFVNPGNDRWVYHDGGGKILSGDRSEAISSFPMTQKPNATYTIGASSDLIFDPANYNVHYLGSGSSLWKTENNGTKYDEIHDFGEDVASFDIAFSNTEIMYVATYPGWWDTKKIYRTKDAGKNWTDITPTLSVINSEDWVPYDITVSSSNPDHIWIARTSQYGNYPDIDGFKVFKSIDGGDTWINISTPGLDFEGLTNIVHQNGTDGGVYLGTRRAVYYRNNSMNDWDLFNNNLPASVQSVRLIPNYKSGKIRNATNRSVYEADFYEPSVPIAQISSDRRSSYCLRDTVYFADRSVLSDSNVSWQWQFQGGIPGSSNIRNPKVVYNQAGNYDVNLTVTDVYGNDSQTITQFITITDECTADTVPGLTAQLNGISDYYSIPPLNLNSNEVTLSAWIKPEGNQNDFAGIVFSRGGSTTAGISMTQSNELRYHWNDQGWWFASGLIPNLNEWSHIALVITPDSATLYLNGIPSTDSTALGIEEFNSNTLIGRDATGNSRYFKGWIEEVCIWNRSLNIQEIRESMHLTRKPDLETDLIAYYQFNRNEGLVTDRVGIRHASPSDTIIRTLSTTPVGGGFSHTLPVFAGGVYDFQPTGIEIGFPNTGIYPEGDLVMSRIHLNPDEGPGAPTGSSYWVLNNYGINPQFTAPDQINFVGFGEISPAQSLFPNQFKFYQRPFNGEGNTWGSAIEYADNIQQGVHSVIQLNNGTQIIEGGQWIWANETGIATGNQEINVQSAYLVSPNPAMAGQSIYWNPRIKLAGNIEIRNLSGAIIYSQQVKELGALKLSRSFSKGLYIWRFQSGEAVYTGLITVQ